MFLDFLTSKQFAGFFPAIILPISTLLQLLRVIKIQDTGAVSIISWLLFAIANIGAYFFTGLIFNWQSIFAFLVTAILDLIIVIVVIYKRSRTGVA
jgi:uncharacterized protein with PQ loop repeat